MENENKELCLNPISIVDIILHKNQYYTQTFLVLDRMPVFEFERIGNHLVSEDSGFFCFFGYQRPSKSFQAFCGRKFTIKMKDEEDVNASGEWWDSVPSDYMDLVSQHGIGTIEGLNKCNVFMGGYVDPDIVSYWLANNDPSNNYEKYAVRDKDYGMHKIVSRFDN